jgi:hypothetical protein
MRAKRVATISDKPYGVRFWCPGCERNKVLPVRGWEGANGAHASWEFNGNYDRPTLSPSILSSKDDPADRCHSFIRDGRIEFLSDCGHKLAGQTVELPDLAAIGEDWE